MAENPAPRTSRSLVLVDSSIRTDLSARVLIFFRFFRKNEDLVNHDDPDRDLRQPCSLSVCMTQTSRVITRLHPKLSFLRPSPSRRIASSLTVSSSAPALLQLQPPSRRSFSSTPPCMVLTAVTQICSTVDVDRNLAISEEVVRGAAAEGAKVSPQTVLAWSLLSSSPR